MTVRFVAMCALACLLVIGSATAEESPTGRRKEPGTALDRARQMLDGGDFASAAGAAREVLAENPDSGDAYFVLGMAQFQSRRYADALDSFMSARRSAAPPPPGPLSFNEAAALYRLGRHKEAEAAFVTAAQADGRLAALASVNAGLSALRAGDRTKAHQFAEAARLLASGQRMAQPLAELEEELAAVGRVAADASHAKVRGALRAGMVNEAVTAARAALVEGRAGGVFPETEADLLADLGAALTRAGRHEEAREAYQSAVSIRPDDAELRFDLALAELHSDEPAAARASIQRALGLGLNGESRQLALVYLDTLASGLRSNGRGIALRGTVGGGYDSNVAQLSSARTETIAAEMPEEGRGSAFGTAVVDVQYGLALGDHAFLLAGYIFDQRAYADPVFSRYSLQSHSAALSLEGKPFGWVRFALTGAADWQLDGTTSLDPFQRVLGLEPEVALDVGERTTTSLYLRAQRRTALSEDAAPYAGTRLDLRLTQRLRWRAFRFDVSGRRRHEQAGAALVDLGEISRAATTGLYTVPHGYLSHALTWTGDLKIGPVRLLLDGFYERVRYEEDNVLVVRSTSGGQREVGRIHREDDRVMLGYALSVPLGTAFDLQVRHDVIINESNLDFAFDDRSFTKQLLAIELGASFW